MLDVHASKLKPIARRMVFVGLEPGSNTYRFWDTVHSKIVVSVDAQFDESTFPARADSSSPSSKLVALKFDYESLMVFPEQVPSIPATTTTGPSDFLIKTSHPAEDPPTAGIDNNGEPTVEIDSLPDITPAPPDEEVNSPAAPTFPTRHSTRTITMPKRYGFLTTETDSGPSDNLTYDEALAGPDRTHWLSAMTTEWEFFCQHNVGTLVEPPTETNVLGGMWVFSRPRDEHHRVIKYKARYVIFGNHQVHGLDFNDTYASVGRSDSM